MAGCREHLFSHFHKQGGVSFAIRPPDHSRLAEPAAAGATARDFQRDAVVNGLHQRNNGFEGMPPGIEIADGSFFDDFIVMMNGGNIHAGYVRQFAKQPVSGDGFYFAFADGCNNIADDFFAFADNERIDKISKRRGIKTAGTACNNQRMSVPAFFTVNRDTSQVQHIEHIGIGKFVLQ